MKFLSCLRVETGRMIKSPLTWIFVFLSAVSPLFGFTVFKLNGEQTASTQMIINPVLTGTIGSGILFALFTLFDLDKVYKYKTAMLIDAIAPPMLLHSAKMFAVLCISIITYTLTVPAYFPYTMHSMQSFFDPALYVAAYTVFMLPAMWIGSLLAAVFYQVFRRVDISFVLIAACVLGNYAGFINEDFLLRWINPLLPVFSDGFGNSKPLRMGMYNRLFLITFLCGLWFMSLLCTRKYAKGIFASIAHNIRCWYLLPAGVFLLAVSMYLYRSQPFFNDAPPEVDWNAINDTGAELRYDTIQAEIYPNFTLGTLYGEIVYKLDNDNGEPAVKRMRINSGYRVYNMTVNGEPVPYTDLSDDNFVIKHIQFEIPEGNDIELMIEYGGYPAMWGAYKTFSMGGSEISRRNIELSTDALIPSLSADLPAGKPDVQARIVLPDHFTVLSLQDAVDSVIDNNNGTKTWVLADTHDSLGIYASDYAVKQINAETMNAEFYYHSKFYDILEQNSMEEVLRDVFDYCTKRFGPLHYLKDNSLKLIQTTAYNFGGGAIPGMSEMSETTFSIYSLSDPWKGAAGKEILAHEIIHQWWGLNRMIWENEDDPGWTSEGLTVYTTYRLYKEKYGEEYGIKNYVEKWEQEVQSMRRNFYYRHPEYLDRMPEDFAAHIRINAREVEKYCLMPLQIYKAAGLVGGEDAMDAILAALAQANNSEQLTFQEFLDACELTREDLYIE